MSIPNILYAMNSDENENYEIDEEYFEEDDQDQNEEVEIVERRNNNYNSKLLNFKKIKSIKFGNPLIEKYLCPINFNDFIKFEDINDAFLEADSRFSYFFYKFYQKNKVYPYSIFLESEVLKKSFFEKIIKELNLTTNNYAIEFHYDNKNVELNIILISLKKIIIYHDGHTTWLIFHPDFLHYLNKNIENPLTILLGLIKKYKCPRISKNKIYIVYRNAGGFQKKSFPIKKRNINLEDNYNEGFVDISKEIINKLNNNKKNGLIILYGPPGTGKTTYLRYLTGKLKKNIIFISPDMVDHITSPEFIPFLMNNSDSILIIEDAEPALHERSDSGRSGAVSNILNMTDGLLSDCINISIVATFNTEGKNIDPALLRKGRLLKAYKFENLSIEKSQKLINKIGYKVEIKDSMTLAEIYFYGDKNKEEYTGLERTRIKGLGQK